MGLRKELIRIVGGRKRIEIGPKNENLVREACAELKREGKIIDFKKKDRPGSDFLIYFPDGGILKLEIKSSFYGKFLHEIRYSTPVLVVPSVREPFSFRGKRKLLNRIKRNILGIDKEQEERSRTVEVVPDKTRELIKKDKAISNIKI